MEKILFENKHQKEVFFQKQKDIEIEQQENENIIDFLC